MKTNKLSSLTQQELFSSIPTKVRCIYIGPSFVSDSLHHYSYGLTGYTYDGHSFIPDDKCLSKVNVKSFDLYLPSM